MEQRAEGFLLKEKLSRIEKPGLWVPAGPTSPVSVNSEAALCRSSEEPKAS